MQALAVALLALAATGGPGAAAAVVRQHTNPLSKVIDLLSELEAKVIAEGEAEQKAYEEYVEWCDDASKNTQFEIKTATDKKAKLEASIEKSTTDIEGAATNIEALAGSIAAGEEELANATLIREKENADFIAAEAELVDSIDVLDRAIGILERELQKSPALMQVDTTTAKRLVASVGAVIDAVGAFSGSDRKKLLAMLQAKQGGGSDAGDEEAEQEDEKALGAPDPDAYKGHSGSIVDVLEDLKEKAESELADLRKSETNAQHNFNMLKQSLEDQKAFDEKDMGEEKSNKAAAEQSKATAEGDLAMTVKALANAEEVLATAQSTCMQVAADHEANVNSRAEELKAIATAKKILADTTAGASAQAYGLLLEGHSVSGLRTRADLVNAEVVDLVKRLAQQHHSAALAQLASKITAVLRYGTSAGEDPFVKVRELIQELIDRLMKEAAAEATEKAYCDSEMAKTEEKKGELEDDVAKLVAKIDKASAASAQLKAEVKQHQADLAALAKMQAEMDKLRQDEHAAYVTAKADLEAGLTGVRQALGVLRDYYASGGEEAMLQDGAHLSSMLQQPAYPEKHSKASGAGGGIIDILEVVEADFAKGLAKEESQEDDAATEYEKTTQENKVTKSITEQDVKYKTQEFKGLDKSISELSSDRDTANTELNAVLDYYSKLKDRCIAKPESYEERKARREAEIAGLKQALEILENETALLQRGGRGLRR